MTIIANLLVCALLLMTVAAFWILVSVWLDRDKLGSPKLVRGDDPRADKSVDPLVIDSDRVEWYPVKDEPPIIHIPCLCTRCGRQTEDGKEVACCATDSGIWSESDGCEHCE